MSIRMVLSASSVSALIQLDTVIPVAQDMAPARHALEAAVRRAAAAAVAVAVAAAAAAALLPQ